METLSTWVDLQHKDNKRTYRMDRDNELGAWVVMFQDTTNGYQNSETEIMRFADSNYTGHEEGFEYCLRALHNFVDGLRLLGWKELN